MSIQRLFFCLAILIIATATSPGQRRRITEDRDLIDLDLAAWDCLNQPGGSAKTDDGVERNRCKNRAPISQERLSIPGFETAGFSKALSALEAQTKFTRRKDLGTPQKVQLAALEKQLVSFTGYLVLAYAGPPESANCGSTDFHDWHLEVFEKPLDHAPGIGDPTPIVCEITPRTQPAIYRAGIRLQDLAAFMRRPDLTIEPTGHAARKIRLTGYLLWDDEHNGTADVGLKISEKGNNGYHHPWRSTAWELHPVSKIEPLEGPPPTPVASPAPTRPDQAAPAAPLLQPAAPPPPPPTPTPGPQVVTILEPVKVKIPYGETVLPRGMKFEVISRDAKTVTVHYVGRDVVVPLPSTDLR